MNAKTVDQFTPVYSLPAKEAAAIFQLPAGEEIIITSNSNPSWVSIVTPDGRTGYIPRKSHLFPIREVALKQNQATVMAQPADDSTAVYTMVKGDTFVMNGILKNDAGEWVEIKYIGEQTGFIPGSTRIRKVINKQIAYKNIGIGAMCCILGGIVAIGAYDNVVQVGGLYVIACCAILFGAIRLFRGLIQLY